MCGELRPRYVRDGLLDGSSPRVRGTRTSWFSTRSPTHGSSPRVRGTPAPVFLAAPDRRFIPACAGNSPSHTPPAMASTGSSPRVRGTQYRSSAQRTAPRFIPACAGNSTRGHAHGVEAPVHPRVCGELPRHRAAALNGHGSSPRVRGTQRPARLPPLGGRFIPACAGNSEVVERHVVAGAGSSPRVRGTRHDGCRAAEGRRFIPACAGNSAGLDAPSGPDTVHPRVCGELGIELGVR